MLNFGGEPCKSAPPINTVTRCYNHMILGDYFNLRSLSENLILTILKATQVSEVVGLDNLFRIF